MQVPVVKTSFTSRESFARATHAAAVRQGLSTTSAELLVAHIALSTNWGKSIDNYRVAGAKAGAEWRACCAYTVATGCECVVGLENKSDPKCICDSGYGQRYSKAYWRAYDSLDEGVADMLKLLQAARYRASWALLQAGDEEYFAQVGRDGWYTADPKKLKSLMSGHREKIASILREGGGAVASLGIPVALAIAYLIWRG